MVSWKRAGSIAIRRAAVDNRGVSAPRACGRRFSRRAYSANATSAGRGRHRGAGEKRELGSAAIPEHAGEHARREQRQARDQVEDAERRAALLGSRGVGDERREQPLREAHVQSPQRDAERRRSDRRAEREHEIRGDQERRADGEHAPAVRRDPRASPRDTPTSAYATFMTTSTAGT